MVIKKFAHQDGTKIIYRNGKVYIDYQFPEIVEDGEYHVIVHHSLLVSDYDHKNKCVQKLKQNFIFNVGHFKEELEAMSYDKFYTYVTEILEFIELENDNIIVDTIKNVTEKLLKAYTETELKIFDDRWKCVGVSSLNDINVVRLEKNYPCKYSFWAGTSGTNWNLIDQTGGNHMVSNFENEIVMVKMPDKWIKK